MTLSAFLSSVLSGNTPHAKPVDRGVRDAPDAFVLPSSKRIYGGARPIASSFPMTEIALPATALRNRAIAKWVTEHRVSVDVHSGEDLAVAIAAGVHLPRLTLHADALSDSDLARCRQAGSRPGSRQFGPADRSAEIRCGATGAGCRRPDDRRQHAGLAVADGGDLSRAASGSTAMNRISRSQRFSTTSGSIWWDCIATSARKTTTSSAIRPRSVT